MIVVMLVLVYDVLFVLVHIFIVSSVFDIVVYD